MTDGSAGVTDSFTYGAWGSVLADNPAGNQKPYQYIGQLGYYTFDSTNQGVPGNLLQLGARFYDPTVGRFTQRDPLRAAATIDYYTYAAANPAYGLDPTGMSWKGMLCRAACWALGAAACGVIMNACTAGDVVTIGGLTIPCAAAVIAGCSGCAGLSSVCSDLCSALDNPPPHHPKGRRR